MEELTQEQIEKNVSAAFDSVNLINELRQKETLTEEEQDTITRNQQHLEIMLKKDWFSKALSSKQKTEINASKK